MKKYLLASLSAVALVGLMGFTGAQAASIVGSSHDLYAELNGQTGPSGTPGNVITVGTTEICIFCHTPHGATSTEVPLWWRLAPVQTTWTMYDSPTLDFTPGTAPQGVSLACLSCHDGVSALDSLQHIGGNTITNTDASHTTMADWKSWMIIGDGGELGTEHPISFNYDTSAGADLQIKARTVAEAAGLRFFGSSGDQMECATCHNPHDPANDPFLRVDNAGSALCLTCHDK